MSSYLQDAMDRIVAMQKEAVTTADAVPYWPYEQASFPYFTNRLGTMTLNQDMSEDIDIYEHTVLMRYVVGHLTEGYRGDLQDSLYDDIASIETYFREHPHLTTNAGSYTTAPDYLFQVARILSHTGVVAFAQGGVGQIQIGVEFTLSTPFLRLVY